MPSLRPWPRGPRGLILLFALVLLVPAGAAIYLGRELVREDRELATRRGLERRENAAELFATALEQAIAATERHLASGAAVPSGDKSGAVVVTWRRQTGPAAVADFEEAEQLEFNLRDLDAAAAVYRKLSGSDRNGVRAGSLLRLARVERHRGHVDVALSIYRALASIESVTIAGVPADLVARRATCELLHEHRRTAVLVVEAARLQQDLLGARWPLDDDTWRLYLRQTVEWLDQPLAADVEEPARHVMQALMARWAPRAPGTEQSGRETVTSRNGPSVLLWQTSHDGLSALITTPAFVADQWADPAARALRDRSVHVALVGAAGEPIWGRQIAESARPVRLAVEGAGIPWTIAVADDELSADPDALGPRHRTLVIGLVVIVGLVAGGGYLVARAVTRELQVAALQSDFVAAVSHEFRTPLTSLKQFTDLLTSEDEPDYEERRVFHQAQARATERLRRLVETLLDFGRMEAGARRYQLTPLRVVDVVTATTESFRRDALPSDFTLALCIADDAAAAAVSGDRDALALALWNLLDNAVKYSGNGREIRVTVDGRASAVVIGVHDRGPGIPRTEQSRLFDKFVRGSSSRAHTIQGTGLGLAIVKHVVDGHRGTVRIDSTVGQGTAFLIEVPACHTS